MQVLSTKPVGGNCLIVGAISLLPMDLKLERLNYGELATYTTRGRYSEAVTRGKIAQKYCGEGLLDQIILGSLN